MRRISIVLALLPLAGCGSSSQPASQTSEPSASEEMPTLPPGAPSDFVICTQCHSTVAGQNRTGPSLFGVVGRKAASLPDFAYSAALRKSGITWTPERLNTWLSGPREVVPGTKMTFAGFSDPAKRQAVIAYLQTLKSK